MSVASVVLIEGLLLNALGKLSAGSVVAPGGVEGPSEQWRTGFRAGLDAGEVSGLIMALSTLTGESPKAISDRFGLEADMAREFPFNLSVVWVEGADGAAA